MNYEGGKGSKRRVIEHVFYTRHTYGPLPLLERGKGTTDESSEPNRGRSLKTPLDLVPPPSTYHYAIPSQEDYLHLPTPFLQEEEVGIPHGEATCRETTPLLLIHSQHDGGDAFSDDPRVCDAYIRGNIRSSLLPLHYGYQSRRRS